MAELGSQLEYAPAPHRGRRWMRRVVWAGVLGIVLVVGIKWFNPAWNHVRLLYYQHRCLTHVDPPNTVVADPDPYPLQNKPADDWVRFYSLFSPPGGRFTSTAFLGELRLKDGSPRLVAVDAYRVLKPLPSAHGIRFNVHVIKPGDLWGHPVLCSNGSWDISPKRFLGFPGDKVINCVYAGQRDRDRLDHFTIDFDRDGRREIIDGWLQADDSILFEVRN